MLVANVPLWQQDLHDLGREYFQLVRQVIADDPNIALSMFGFRRPNQMYCLFRLSVDQLDQVLAYGGFPFGIADSLSLKQALIALDSQKLVATSVKPEWQQYVERIQMAFWERVRHIAQVDTAAAATIFRFPDTHTLLSRLAGMPLSQLRRLAKLNVALRINQTAGFDLLLSLVEGGASRERIEIAGLTASTSCGKIDMALSDGPGELKFEVSPFRRDRTVEGSLALV